MTKRVNRPHYKPGPKGKIDSHDATLIRMLARELPHNEIAEKFDISRSSVTHIASNRMWASDKQERVSV